MLTKQLTRQRLLPTIEQELHALLEKRAQNKQRKQHAAAKAVAYRATEHAEIDKSLHALDMM